MDLVQDESKFIRQRRNLILVSVALVLALILEVRVEKNISLSGLSISINQARDVAPAIWILWSYFLWRYWQVFSWLPIRSAYYPAVRDAVQQMAVAKGLKTKPAGDVWELANTTPGAGEENIFGATPVSALERWGGQRLPFAITQFKFAAFVEGKRAERIVDVSLGPAEIRRAKIRALWRIGQNTPLFTEHLLPFGLAMLPLVTLAYCSFKT